MAGQKIVLLGLFFKSVAYIFTLDLRNRISCFLSQVDL